jgi:hypothetical protein
LISKMIVPFFTTATQLSTEPLPDPILTSKGFFVFPKWGKTLIHILPVFLTNGLMTFRPASITRLLT